MEFADAYCPPGKSKNYIQPQMINREDATADEIERTKALYYGYVTFVDKWIGVFLDKLEATGLAEDTAVIFTSDHGTELWDKGKFGKGGDRLYQYNTGIPLVVHLPGRTAAETRDDFVQHQDFFPTICALLGRDTGDIPVAGRDFLDAGSAAPERTITAWYANVSVRDAKWNLVIDSTGGDGSKELYDLQADPDETTNVFDEHPDVVRDLTAFLEAALGPLPYEIRHTGDKRMAPSLYCVYRKDRS